MDRELKFAEFFANGPATGNVGWATGLPGGVPRKPGLFKISGINPNLNQYYVYSYLWVSASADPSAMLCQLSFYKGGVQIATEPVAQIVQPAVGFGIAGFPPGKYQSFPSVAVTGTTDETAALGVTLITPMPAGAVGSAESKTQILLKPMVRAGGWDEVRWDVLIWTNVDTDHFRAILAVQAA